MLCSKKKLLCGLGTCVGVAVLGSGIILGKTFYETISPSETEQVLMQENQEKASDNNSVIKCESNSIEQDQNKTFCENNKKDTKSKNDEGNKTPRVQREDSSKKGNDNKKSQSQANNVEQKIEDKEVKVIRKNK